MKIPVYFIMFYRYLIPFLLIPTFAAGFPFNAINIIVNITLDTAKELHLGCIVVLKPSVTSTVESIFHDTVTRLLIKDGPKRSKMIQVMNYNFSDYVASYMKRDGAKKGSCFKWAAVIMDSDETNSTLQQISHLDMFSVPIWLLFSNNSKPNFDNVSFPFNSLVWLIQPETDGIFSITEVHRVNEAMKEVYTRIGSWSTDHGLQIVKIPANLRRMNLEGIVFRAGSHEHWPIATFAYHGNRTEKELPITGLFPSLWMVMEKILNVTTIYVKSADGSSGGHIADSVWSGLIGQAVRGEIDVIISAMDYSVSRLDAIDILTPILRNNFQVFFRVTTSLSDSWAVFRPFHPMVWAAVTAWIILGAMVQYITSKLSACYGITEKVDKTATSTFFFVLQTLCCQGSSTVPRTLTQRVLFFNFYLTAALILPAYSASLISALSAFNPVKPFDNIHDILKTDYKLLIPTNSSYSDYFAKSNDPFVHEIFRKSAINDSEIFDNPRKTIETICSDKKIALFSHATFIDHDIFQIRDAVTCHILALSRPISIIYQSIALPRYSPYRRTFNNLILKMMESGIISVHKDFYLPDYIDFPPEGYVSLDLIDLSEIFLFYMLAILLSILIFLIELHY